MVIMRTQRSSVRWPTKLLISLLDGRQQTLETQKVANKLKRIKDSNSWSIKSYHLEYSENLHHPDEPQHLSGSFHYHSVIEKVQQSKLKVKLPHLEFTQNKWKEVGKNDQSRRSTMFIFYINLILSGEQAMARRSTMFRGPGMNLILSREQASLIPYSAKHLE